LFFKKKKKKKKKNCIFIDESGFDINMKLSRASALKGKGAAVTRLLTKAPSHSVISVISSISVASLNIRVPKVPPKIRKIQGRKKRKTPDNNPRNDEPNGATIGHIRFILDTLNIVDKYDSLK
jgi:hypothetical protein